MARKLDHNDPNLTNSGQALRTLRAISLDLDDTLWPIMPTIHQAERDVLEWMREHYPAVAAHYELETVSRIRTAVLDEHPDMHHDLTFIRCEVFARVGRLGGESASFAEEAFTVFDRSRNRVELFPDAGQALARLAGRYPLVAVTNGNANLERIGLDHHFSEIVTARGTGVAKPHTDIFHAAASALSLDPEHILHVGDHPEHDVDGARDAGMQTAWVNRNDDDWPTHLDEPDMVVSDLGELAARLTGQDQ